jgi:hypothetical protein
VDDAGSVFGIEADYPMVGRKQNSDEWQLYFTNRVLATLGADVWSSMMLSLEPIDGHVVARGGCVPRGYPTWLKWSLLLVDGKQHQCHEI